MYGLYFLMRITLILVTLITTRATTSGNGTPTSDSLSLPCNTCRGKFDTYRIQELLFNLLYYTTVNNTMSCSPLFSLGTTQEPQGENDDKNTDSAGND